MPGWGVEIVADTFTPLLARASQRMKAEVAAEMEVVGADMKDMAQSLARVRTGFMRDSVYAQVDAENLTMDFGALAYYSAFNEFGTRRMAAQPFIRPALDANQQKLLDAILVGVMNSFR